MSHYAPLFISIQDYINENLISRCLLKRWTQYTLDEVVSKNSNIKGAALNIRLVGLYECKKLHEFYCIYKNVSNVLTFFYGIDKNGIAHGDIALCMHVLRREAKQKKKTLLEHTAHIFVHGILHALNYDHINKYDSYIMKDIENIVIRKILSC